MISLQRISCKIDCVHLPIARILACTCQPITLWRGGPLSCGPFILRNVSNIPSSTSIKHDESFGRKALKMLGWLGGFYSRKAILTRSAKVMYECCVEDVEFEKFYDAAGMPDTFQSWFLINQLHVWMCLVRLKPEGKDGRYMYRRMVQIFWEDVEERMKVLGVCLSSLYEYRNKKPVKYETFIHKFHDNSIVCF